MLKPIEAALLSRQPGIRHGFFTREGGVSEGLYASLNCGPGSADNPANVAENRRRVVRHLGGRHDDVVTIYQVHSGNAVAVDAPIAFADRPKADGLATRIPGLAIGILTADCTPVLFADPQAKVVGAAHAGWRGAKDGVLEATISAMEGLGARREGIIAAIGPTINQTAYEVGAEFEDQFLAGCPNNGRFFRRERADARAHFDLPAYVEARLAEARISEIERQTLCTYGNESLFFSFRRSQHRSEGDYGRQIAAIVVT
jgi:YfiH family protein